MTWSYQFNKNINLFVQGRIQEKDANRQEVTASAVLERLQNYPGQIVADEVGMGKTFVALAVAVSVAVQDNKKRPVVIMIPTILAHKWPKDLHVFVEKCLPEEFHNKVTSAVADSTVDFLKLLDDPEERRNSIIFLTQSAFNRSLQDQYVMLAMIQRAIYRRWDTKSLKERLHRYGAGLLQLRGQQAQSGYFISELLDKDPMKWKNILVRKGILDAEDDDPIPEYLVDALYEMDSDQFDNLFNVLNHKLPYRTSRLFDSHLKELRHLLKDELRQVWNLCMYRMEIQLPLLIIDEAHHLKNAKTRFASLFQNEENAEEVSKGQLAKMFERMLFLTATPFQLGHNELINVLYRFTAINWENVLAPPGGRDQYEQQLNKLGDKLDQAQKAAIRLDEIWQQLNETDLEVNGERMDVHSWWSTLNNSPEKTSLRSQKALSQFNTTGNYMREAESLLKPLVIRHMRSRVFQDGEIKRRNEFPGRAIVNSNTANAELGLELNGNSLFPFLLAARLTALTPQSRPVFAEGLASSFDAFLYTREKRNEAGLDDDDSTEKIALNESQGFYLGEIEGFLKRNISKSHLVHPKISATISKAVGLWLQGEKVLVFCHYIATGRALRYYISQIMRNEIEQMTSRKMGCTPSDALDELDKVGDRFDSDRLRSFIDSYVGDFIAKYLELVNYKADLISIIRRYLRTPSFLIRFYPLEQQKYDEEEIRLAFQKPDFSDQTFAQLLDQFFTFLNDKCSDFERKQYIEALSSIQTGGIRGSLVQSSFDQAELQGAQPDTLLPNVRLANGSVDDETRQKLMLTFNTPFYPDVLVASSVMAEGVDLHLNCRYIIHHDLCWNPSTLEQRTGRVDRIGAKAEVCKMPIQIYYPYIGETQDEKMYRVVMDREKWFKVVMGEKFSVSAIDTDKLAERIEFPSEAADALTFKLNLS